MSDGDPNLR